MSTTTHAEARRYWFFGFLVVVLVGFAILLVFELAASRHREEAAAARNARNMARVLEQHTRSTIEKIDNELADVVAEYGPGLAGDEVSGKNVTAALKRHLDRIPESQSLRVADANGRFIYDATGAPSSATIWDRAYFRQNRDDPDAGLVISEPIFARITKNWVITLSRRFSHRDGRFAGLVQAAVRADYFQSFYQSLDTGPGGVVALYDTNLRMVARHPAIPGRLGTPLRNSLAEKALRQGVKEVVYDGTSTLDGKMRLWVFRRVEGMPFFVVVGMSHDSLYAQWRRTAWIYGSGALVLTLVLLVLAVRWQRSYSRVADVAADMSAAFSQSDSRNRALLDSIPDFAWLSDADGRFVAVNQTYARALGCGPDEMVGRTPDDFWPADIARTLKQWRLAVLAEPRLTRFDGEIPIPRIGLRHFETIVVPVRDAAGKVIGTAGLGRDISERKAAERALHELNETLEQRVAEEVARNREKDAILIQQSRLAAIGEMMHNVAHHWRQPLSALVLILNNIEDDFKFGDLNQESLEALVARGSRLAQEMSSTIDNFRDFFSSSEEKSRFGLKRAVDDALGILGGNLDSNGIRVVIEVVDDVQVLGYPHECAQVLLHLLTNAKEAIQSRGDGKGVIAVRVQARGAEGLVSVRDDAGGIPPAIIDRVFDPYFTTKEKSTGIGLYLSRMIVEVHMDGRLAVTNSGDGAEFTVSLPRVDS